MSEHTAYRSVSQEDNIESSDDELLDLDHDASHATAASIFGGPEQQESDVGYGSGIALTNTNHTTNNITLNICIDKLKGYFWSTKKRRYATTVVGILVMAAIFILMVVGIYSKNTNHIVHDPDTYHKSKMRPTTQNVP